MGAGQVEQESGEDAPLVAMLQAFLGVHEAGADGDPEQVRMAYCPTCQASAGLASEERDARCEEARCCLRFPGPWLREHVWIHSVLRSSLFSAYPAPADVRQFNADLARIGCAAFGVAFTRDGTLARSYTSASLRGLLHGTLVLAIAYHAGDRLSVNINTTKAAAVKALVGKEREAEEVRRIAELKRQAATLRDEDLSDSRIAQSLGYTTSRIRQWLGKREDWPERRERWWEQHGP